MTLYEHVLLQHVWDITGFNLLEIPKNDNVRDFNVISFWIILVFIPFKAQFDVKQSKLID